jgi:flavin-dependent dehydrogenase
VGFGRRDLRGFPAHLEAFTRFLEGSGRVPPGLPRRWPGHAYLLYEGAGRAVVADGALLVGDAAGLAHSRSGEGIGPAIESGLLAARTILAARGHYLAADLAPYARALSARFGPRPRGNTIPLLPAPLHRWLGARLLSAPFATRRLVLDRWFLHRAQPVLPPC